MFGEEATTHMFHAWQANVTAATSGPQPRQLSRSRADDAGDSLGAMLTRIRLLWRRLAAHLS